jgi:hypothetical protein
MGVTSHESRRPLSLVVAGIVLAAGISLAIGLPDSYVCPAGTHVHEQHQHLNYQNFFRDCLLNNPSALDAGEVYRPSSPDIDGRMPLRVAIVGANLTVAVVALYLGLGRRGPRPDMGSTPK